MDSSEDSRQVGIYWKRTWCCFASPYLWNASWIRYWPSSKCSVQVRYLKHFKNLDGTDILHPRGQDELSLTATLQVEPLENVNPGCLMNALLYVINKHMIQASILTLTPLSRLSWAIAVSLTPFPCFYRCCLQYWIHRNNASLQRAVYWVPAYTDQIYLAAADF